MPQYDIQSPGANAGMAIQKYLLDQAARERQSRLDAQAQAHQQEQERMAREQAQRQAEMQAQTIKDAEQQRQIALMSAGGRGTAVPEALASTDVGRMMSDAAAPAVTDIVTPETNPTKQQGIYPGIIASSAPSISNSASAPGRVSRGTVDEQTDARDKKAQQDYIAQLRAMPTTDPDYANAQRAARLIEYELKTNKNAPAGIFEPPVKQPRDLYLSRTGEMTMIDPATGKREPLPIGFQRRAEDVVHQEPTPASTGGNLLVVHGMDANGNPTVNVVEKKLGSTYSAAPGAVVMNRLKSAQTVISQGDDVTAQLSDPKFAAQIGPVIGRYNSLLDFLGNPPPEYAQLAGEIESIAMANMGVHGFRAIQGANELNQAMSKIHTPEALAAYIKGLHSFARDFIQRSGLNPETNTTITPQPPPTTSDTMRSKSSGIKSITEIP